MTVSVSALSDLLFTNSLIGRYVYSHFCYVFVGRIFDQKLGTSHLHSDSDSGLAVQRNKYPAVVASRTE
jgi:hypothetical protein